MSDNADQVNTTSPNISEEKREQLKKIFPEVFEEDQIDIDKLKAIIGEEDLSDSDGYSLNWTGRKKAIKNIQETSKGTLSPKKEHSVNFENSENILIEGENLETLKLLKKSYSDSVKMIYIDPPYNKGKDFVYNDDYSENLQNYLEKTGQIDSEGNNLTTNRETDGRFHSNWLSMMYPRLFVARSLLKRDGVIFVSIDGNELNNLLHIMDEIFGEENREAVVSWRRRHNQPNDATKMISKVSEFIVIYAKDSEYLKEEETFYGVPLSEERKSDYTNPDDDPRGPWGSKPWKSGSNQSGSTYEIETPTGKTYNEEWLGSKERFEELKQEGRIYFPRDGDGFPRKKFYLEEREEEGQPATDFWTHKRYGSNQKASAELKELFDGETVFENPKPTDLIRNMLRLSTEDDLVMDFFAGTGTLGHAVYKQNEEDGHDRNFIMVQLQEELPESNKKQLDNGTKLETVSDIAVERLRRVVNGKGQLKDVEEGFKVFRLEESNYKVWNDLNSEDSSVEDVKRQMKLFENALVEDYNNEDVLYEILLKEGMTLNAKLERRSDRPVYEIKDSNDTFYVSLDQDIGEDIVEGLEYNQDTVFICLDNALGDDEKINLSNKLKLKTI